MPLVSVVIPSYNHGQFVEAAVRSALAQTFDDIEIVAVDDGSQDDSVQRLQAIDDHRFRLIAFEQNRGAVDATNTGINVSTGEYVAILNSDDCWTPNKIAEQLTVFRGRPELGAVFSWAGLIDERGCDAPETPSKLKSVFSQPNRSRGQWLRQFFFHGNCLCHPSVLIRREVYEKVGAYDERFRQLPDFEMWIRVCKQYDIHVMPKELVAFRILDGFRNTGSTRNRANSIRACAELMLIADRFFDDIELPLFLDGFQDECIADHVSDRHRARIEQAFLLAATPTRAGHCYRAAGLRKLFQLLGDREAAEILKADYRFGPHEFYELSGRNDLFGLHPEDLPVE